MFPNKPHIKTQPNPSEWKSTKNALDLLQNPKKPPPTNRNQAKPEKGKVRVKKTKTKTKLNEKEEGAQPSIRNMLQQKKTSGKT